MFKVATLNVRGFNSRRKQYQVKRLLLDNAIDVLAVQETKVESVEETTRVLSSFLSYFEVCVSHAKGASGGCMLFLRKSLNARVESVLSDSDGKIVLCDCNIRNVEYRIINVYAPNNCTCRKVFFESIRSYLECERKVVLLGDFNCVCDPTDRSSRMSHSDSSAKYLKEMTTQFCLQDIANSQRTVPSLRFTHFQSARHARLDRAYVSIELLTGYDDYHVLPVFFSDHALVSFIIGGQFKKPKFQWDLWKFNDTLLEDEVFNDSVQKLINTMKGEDESAIERWERFKCELKLRAVERSSQLAYWKRTEEKLLLDDLQRVCRLESENPGRFADDLQLVKNTIAEHETKKYRGALVRARAEKYILGERPTKRALSAESRHGKKKTIDQIEYGGYKSSCPDVIQKAFVEYYSNLLQRKEHGNDTQLQDYLAIMPRLNDEIKERLEESISVKEVESAIDELPIKKSPGPDGLTAAIYKKYKNVVAGFVHAVVLEAHDKNRLPPSFLNTYTVLIPKSDNAQQLQYVKNYRPIALSNVDYKIIMKILAKRLQNVICEIVGEHQTCGIRGRSILTNIHIVRSLLELCDDDLDQVAMLQIDLEKAFGRVQHSVLYKILEHVNVGDLILRFVKMAYSGCTTQLIVNGKPSTYISVMSSVKQGCPLSPLLFSIYLEAFCRKVFQNRCIIGFTLQSTEIKLLSYADDIALFCKDKKSIVEAVSEVKTFCQLTGAAVNWDKCCGLWHGTWATKPDIFEGIPFTSTPSRYLGVPLQHYKKSNEYWATVVEDTREKTSKWGGWELSIFSRATVCNVFLIAKF